MNSIFLIRHAEAHSGKKGLSDYDRPLVPKGEKTAKKMAKRLKLKYVITPDLIISSPAQRALTTAHIFADVLHFPIRDIVLKADIYDNATEDMLLKMVRQIKDKNHTIFIIGHEPTLGKFSSFLVKDFNSSIPKSGLVGINFNKKTWKDISRGDGEIKVFDFPENKLSNSDIRKKFQKDLRANISTQITSMLAAIDAEVTKNIKMSAKKASAKLAKEFVRAAGDYGDKSLLSKIAQNYCIKEKGEEASQKNLKHSNIQSDRAKEEGGRKSVRGCNPAAKKEPTARVKAVAKATSPVTKRSSKRNVGRKAEAITAVKPSQSKRSSLTVKAATKKSPSRSSQKS